MSANRPTMRLRKGDTVKVIAGSLKGKTGKVLATNATAGTVTVEGLNIVTRSMKPNQLNPRGGRKELHKGLPVSNVALVVDEKTGKTSRVGYAVKEDGTKVRVAKALKNKEIK